MEKWGGGGRYVSFLVLGADRARGCVVHFVCVGGGGNKAEEPR